MGMARHSFAWICQRQQANARDRHARLIMLKNTAYAWRQMLFFLSFVSKQDLGEFIAWAREQLSIQHPDFQDRFSPALAGLILASQGIDLDSDEARRQGARRFLGWIKGQHWLTS